MEKIFIKSTPREILFKNSKKEGHLDIFSYDYDSDEAKRKLGSLYIVGNIQQDDSAKSSKPGEDAVETDVTYVTNLVASLAKREYYSNTDLSPREAFSATLKKINEVVDEFFVSKDIKINIGIFALAGEGINISKLGKFKIFLARGDKNIDILNNIDLFTKEKVEEKEFSHVVSGKIAPGDKIFAFYPGRYITAREKVLKNNFLKLDTESFLEKMYAIKEDKPDFTCAALYIDVNRIKEPALTPEVDKKEDIAAPQNTPQLASEPKKSAIHHKQVPIEEPELPRIIRAEFSLGRKENPVTLALGKIKMLLPQRENKMIFFASLIVLVLVGAWAAKSLFIVSPGQKQANTAVSQAQDNIKLAKTKISQNDFLGARKLLLGSIVGINSVDPSKKTEDAKSEIFKLLDNLDQATESSPTLTEALPKELKVRADQLAAQKEKTGAIALDIYEDNLYYLAADGISKISDVNGKAKKAVAWLKGGTLPPDPLLIAVDGNVYVINKSGLMTTYYRGEKKSDVNTLILPDDSSVLATTKDSKYLYLINKNMGRIYLLNKDSGALAKTIKVSSQEGFTAAYLGSDEAIYLVSKDSKIWKVQ